MSATIRLLVSQDCKSSLSLTVIELCDDDDGGSRLTQGQTLREIKERLQKMTITYRIVFALLVMSLAACSGVSSAPPIEIAAPRSEAMLESVEFPPTWTPTSVPTQVPATETPQASTNPATPELSSSLPALNAATPVPASMSIASWQKVEGATAAFYLPSSFEVLDMGSEFGLIMAALMTGLMEGMVDMANELGEEFGVDPITPTPMDMSELEAAFNIDFVLAMEGDQKTSAFLFSEPLEEATSLEGQMQATLDEQENPFEVLSMDRVMDSPYETGRMNLRAIDSESGEPGYVLIYIILLDDRVYQLGYTTPVDRFEELLPIFETSASTFSVNP
jgi:hypothetical protein